MPRKTYQVVFYRRTHDREDRFYEENRETWDRVWGSGINGFTGHMGSSEGDTFCGIYTSHIHYGEDHIEDPPSIPAVLRAMADLVESGIYEAEVKEVADE